MWGKVIDIAEQWRLFGITPTHVGKSWEIAKDKELIRDHPHPCGEKAYLPSKDLLNIGSPPPMWGKVAAPFNAFGFGRITPTHVGKSTLNGIMVADEMDHPHPCGEKEDEQFN